jgi:hypothetical protein
MSIPVIASDLSTGGLRTARVVGTPAAGFVHVIHVGEPTEAARPARLACGAGVAPGAGAEVLVAAADDGGLFVLAELSATPAPTSVAAPDGARAELRDTGAGPELRVHGPDGSLLFSYRSRDGRAQLHGEADDVVLRARSGRLRLVAREGIDLAAEEISANAGRGLRATAGGSTRLALQGGSALLATAQLGVRAERAAAEVGETCLTGRSVEARVGVIRTVAQRCETTAQTIVERAEDVYRRATGLVQVQAGRLRMLVAGIWQARARKVVVKGDEDVKLRGERIHLG